MTDDATLTALTAELRRLEREWLAIDADPDRACDAIRARHQLETAAWPALPTLLDAAERLAAVEAERGTLRARLDELYSLAEGAKP